MVYHGYLALGGHEVVNNARAVGMSRSRGVFTLASDGREARVEEALNGGVEYSIADLPSAPWFDPGVTDASSEFLGLSGLGIKNLNNVDRQLQVVEGIRDGAELGRSRVGPPRVRAEAVALATSSAGMDHGLAWLRGVLAGVDRADAEVFVELPPSRPVYESWVETARNLVPSPSVRDFTVSGAFDAELLPGYGVKLTRTGTGAGSISIPVDAPAGEYVVAVEALAFHQSVPAGADMTVVFGGVGEVVALPDASLSAQGNGYAEYRVTVTGGGPTLELLLDEDGLTQVGHVFAIRRVGVFNSPYTGPLFDDSTEGDDDTRYVLDEGLVVREERTVTPYSDDEYAAVVRSLKRVLRETSVESGPLVTEEWFDEVTGVHGAVVEFDLVAGRPGLYGVTERVALPATVSVVVEDILHNLVNTPRVGRLPGSFDVSNYRAVNFMRNPSIETNLTYMAWEDEAITGDKPSSQGLVTQTRTSELAAAGSWSSMLRLLGKTTYNSGGRRNSVIRQLQQTNPLWEGTEIIGSVWAAGIIAAATSATYSRINSLTARFLMNGAQLWHEETVTGADIDGYLFEAPPHIVQAGETSVVIEVDADVEWTSSATAANNSDIRIYADAFFVATV